MIEYQVTYGDGFITVSDFDNNILASEPAWFSAGKIPLDQAEMLNDSPYELVSVSDVTAGTYGEYHIDLTFANISGHTSFDTIFPAFSSFLYLNPSGLSAENILLMDISPSHDIVERNALAYIGGAGILPMQPVGFPFQDCIFASMPCGERFLCSLLRIKEGQYPVSPGGTLSCELVIYSGIGNRNNALDCVFRQFGCYVYNKADYDFSIYKKMPWVSNILLGFMNWAWDQEVLDPYTGQYQLARSLNQWQQKIGKIDLYIFWPFWPRAGIDDRSQFEQYASFPDAAAGLRQEFSSVQCLGIKVILAYCYWSDYELDGNEPAKALIIKESYKRLVDWVIAVGADGFDMDCMANIPAEILELAEKNGRYYLPYNEGDPDLISSQNNLVGRIHDASVMKSFNLKRYMLPHHPILRVCGPGLFGRRMRNDFVLSLFNGHGIEVNTMFGENDPACEADWLILRKILLIMRENRRCFTSDNWQPMISSLDRDVWINQWPAANKTLFTICSTNPGGHSGELLKIKHQEEVRYIDLYHCRTIIPQKLGDDDVLSIDIKGFEPGLGNNLGNADYSPGCIGIYPRALKVSLALGKLKIIIDDRYVEKAEINITHSRYPQDKSSVKMNARPEMLIDLYQCFGHTNEAIIVRLCETDGELIDIEIVQQETVRLFVIDKIGPTAYNKYSGSGMILIPGGEFKYAVCHSQPIWQYTYLNTLPGSNTLYETLPQSSPLNIKLNPFYIDRYNVTNAEYLRFIAVTGYLQDQEPDTVARQGFLRHLDSMRIPAGQEDYPVVNVSYQDAKAYCTWAGKRLPTEVEWQYAAGAADGRTYPWGNDMEISRYNCTSMIISTRLRPAGASPFGVEDLVGNVWQYTNDVYSNGRHLSVYLRGGCWFDRYAGDHGKWWVRGGIRSIIDHQPLPFAGPALNRLSTVGFRCASDCDFEHSNTEIFFGA